MQVVREYYPDHIDKTQKLRMEDVASLMPAGNPIALARIKAEPKLPGQRLSANHGPPYCPYQQHMGAFYAE